MSPWVRALLENLLGAAASVSAPVRRAIVLRAAELSGVPIALTEGEPGGSVDEALAPYVEQVACRAVEIKDADLEQLRQAGYGDEHIYDVTVSAAVGASLARLERGLALLEGKR